MLLFYRLCRLCCSLGYSLMNGSLKGQPARRKENGKDLVLDSITADREESKDFGLECIFVPTALHILVFPALTHM